MTRARTQANNPGILRRRPTKRLSHPRCEDERGPIVKTSWWTLADGIRTALSSSRPWQSSRWRCAVDTPQQELSCDIEEKWPNV